MLSNITIALLGIVDTAVVGHLSQPYYLGGVTLAMVIFNFLYWGLSFLRMGTTGIVAQHFGANQPDLIRSSLGHAVILALALSFFVLIFQSLISGFCFSILHGSEEVKFHASRYFDIAIWAVPAILINLVMTGWLLGMHNAKATLLITAFINVLNIILDLFFVLNMNMEVDGVALATVISQYSGVLLSLWLCNITLKNHPGVWQQKQLFDVERIFEMLSVNHNLFLRTLSLIFVFSFFTHQGAGQSDEILAANAILKNFYLLMALTLDGFAIASEVLSGKAIGEKNHSLFWDSVLLSMLWSGLFALIITITYCLFGHYLIDLMTSISSVQTLANDYLVWVLLATVISVWSYVWDGVFTGSRKAREMRNSMVFATFIIFFPAWYFSQSLGNHGLWLAFILFLLARTVTMTVYAYYIERDNGFVSKV